MMNTTMNTTTKYPIKYQIIYPSEMTGQYRLEIADAWYRGIIPELLCGWRFEFRRVSDGEIMYGSDQWITGTPEDFTSSFHPDTLFCAEYHRGWTPTGRVVFVGYGQEYYDTKFCVWDIKPVVISDVNR